MGRRRMSPLPGRQHAHLPQRTLAWLRYLRWVRGIYSRSGTLLIKVAKHLKFEELAPLTDAGLTPYRGIKKIRDAGGLGPDRVIGVFGIGGLGTYAVQYAKLLGAGATVVALARNPGKLAMAKQYGADHVIDIKGKSASDVGKELKKATARTSSMRSSTARAHRR